MRRVLVSMLAVALAACQVQPEKEPSDGQKPQATKSSSQKNSRDLNAKDKVAAAPTSKPKKLGPKATADSYELSDACKIVSGSVLRIMHFASVKGELKAEKPPKAIRFTLEGVLHEGFYPKAKLAIYDPAAKSWQTLDTLTVKGTVEKKYPLSNIPAGTVAFLVRYDDVEPTGGKVRPGLFVKSVELEF